MTETFSFKYEKCECGVKGDMIIASLDGKADFAWCIVCGSKININKEATDEQAN